MIGTYSDEAIAEALAERKQKPPAVKTRKTQGDPGYIYAMRIERSIESSGSYPFAVAFFDGVKFRHFWGRKCLTQAKEFLWECEPGLIYFHRGDARDFQIIFDWFEGRITFSRDMAILGGEMLANRGTHRIVDSVTLFDHALDRYRSFYRGDAPAAIEDAQRGPEREQHRRSILLRMKWECGAIWKTIAEFRAEYGPHCTLGAAAIDQVKARHWFAHLSREDDREIRPYYKGGMNRVFAEGFGVFTGDFKLYDVNSMYAYIMRSYLHPIGHQGIPTETITPATCFLIVREPGRQCFTTTIHEYKMGLRLKLWKSGLEIVQCHNFPDQGTFAEFVEDFHSRRLAAMNRGDELRADLANDILRAASGKFAQNPNHYFEYKIQSMNAMPLSLPADVRDCFDCHEGVCFEHWTRLHKYPEWNKEVWRRNRSSNYVLNVATAASITGAARSIEMRASAGAIRPMYCDTDSLICESIREHIDPRELGAWKLESRGHTLAIASLKHYALFGDQCPTCKRSRSETGTCDDEHFHRWGCVKLVCAGAYENPAEILAAARGERELRQPDEYTHTIEQLDRALVHRYTLDESGELSIETGLRGDDDEYKGEF